MTEQLHWILDGIDIDAMIRHSVRQYRFLAEDGELRLTRRGGSDSRI
jgi:hypothetical protein